MRKGRDRTMLFNYQEAIARYGTDYKLQKALKKKDIYKIEKGIYSDRANNFTIYELMTSNKRSPSVFVNYHQSPCING